MTEATHGDGPLDPVDAAPGPAWEVTLVLGAPIRRQVERIVRAHGRPVALPHLLTQALEVGLTTLERTLTTASTRERLILTPTEWARRHGAAGQAAR